jgi:hypothetical protein
MGRNHSWFVRGTLFFAIAMMAMAAPAFALSGAIFTTNSSCATVDQNIYLWLTDVYLDGGPNNPHAFGLDPGTYWVRVTTPSGVPLGTSDSAIFTVGSDGRATTCLSLWDNLKKASDGSVGYDVSPNAEYKAWVSTSSAFNPSESKTDNFRVHNPHILVEQSCTPDVFVGDSIGVTITVTNTGSVTLTNVTVVNSFFGTLALPDSFNSELAPGASYSWTVSCPATAAGAFTTTTTASGDDAYFSYTATSATSCQTNVWAPAVSKTAATTYTRTWSWSLAKTANDNGTVTIGPGASAQVCYTVTASATYVDSAWAVGGTITVHNPAPIAASVASVSDSIPSANVQCPGSAPYSIAAGDDLVCTYSAALNGPNGGTNTATAKLTNDAEFSGSADYAFGGPTTELHASATVADAGISIANADATGSLGWTIVQAPIAGICAAPGCSFTYCATVTNTSATCDLNSTATNSATLTADNGSQSASASTNLYSGACPSVCTLTIGYWKTHAGFTGRNADRVTPYLPKSLGAGGGKTVVVTTAAQAVGLLSMSGDASNGVNKLYAQELAAKLNIAHGSSPTAIASTLTASDAFLVLYNAGNWASLSKTQKTSVNQWMSTFDSYNNGLIGPGHCN